MPEIVSKYDLAKLLEADNSPLLIADKNLKINWYNSAFKKFYKNRQLKGEKLTALIENAETFDANKVKSKPTEILLLNKLNATIQIIDQKGKDRFFFVKITNNINTKSSVDEKFIQELRNILTLLLKEKSLSVLAEKIIANSLTLGKADIGIIAYNDQNSKEKNDYFIHDPQQYLPEIKEIRTDLETNLSFINKWLISNKAAMLGSNSPNNLAANLVKSLNLESIVLSPCIFDNNHIATIIIGKIKGTFSQNQINAIEQFAVLLSFAITSIKTRELNTALEARLLQSQKLETIGKLSSGMAHDFSNLLSSIFGSVNLLRKRVPDNENVKKLIDNIENCSIRAKDLTKGLLSFGKPTPRRKELIKPNILLSEISKVVTHTFPKHLEFETNIEENLFDVLGNGTEIYQVFLNLCVNAKEAIEKKGTIKITAKNILVDKKNNVNHPILNPGKYVWIAVQDSGSGIDEENLLRIFEPYFSTKVKETGSGLGLYVTYGIIKAHNGEIEISSKVNEGTTFDVFIPAYEPTKAKFTEEEKIILLAEDEVMLSDLLSELLESVGYNVLKVYNGSEVIKVLTEELKVDMVILDYNMPGMNGLECAKKIRELNLDMPIVLSSGSMSLNDNPELQSIGISSVLNKPYEFDTLLSTINQLI